MRFKDRLSLYNKMHPSAYEHALNFFNRYLLPVEQAEQRRFKVIDFGSYDVNGTLKPIFKNHDYIGIDMAEGPNVNIVCVNNNVPLPDNSCDVIVSSSNFEHDDMFWITFLEMCRLVRSGGLIYINAPSRGGYHAHPIDCWRFYADSWKALEKWGRTNNHQVTLIDSFVDPADTQFQDSVGIYTVSKN